MSLQQFAGLIERCQVEGNVTCKFLVGSSMPAYGLLNVPVGAGAVTGIPVTKSYVQGENDVAETQLALATTRLRAALNVALTWSPPG